MISCIVLKKFNFYNTFLKDAYVKYTRVTNSYKKKKCTYIRITNVGIIMNSNE